MKTILNNIPYTGAEYDNEYNKSSYYVNGFLVASLCFDKDLFETHDASFSQEDLDCFHEEMVDSKERWEYNYKMC